MIIQIVFRFVSMNILIISTFYNFYKYIVRNINNQNCASGKSESQTVALI